MSTLTIILLVSAISGWFCFLYTLIALGLEKRQHALNISALRQILQKMIRAYHELDLSTIPKDTARYIHSGVLYKQASDEEKKFLEGNQAFTSLRWDAEK